MFVALRAILALGYIYVIGMGAYIAFYGLPDFDTRTASERDLDAAIIEARDTTCRIFLSMDAAALTAAEQVRRANCAAR
ncbi:MAG: hypothetical protein ACWA5A_04000 [Marinibacterium sp.]